MHQDAFLIVEDQKSMARLLKAELSKLTQHRIYLCDSLASMNELLSTGVKISVCLSDMNLPDAPNGEAIKALLKHHITTIVVTGTYDDAVRKSMFKLKVADYVLKDGISSIRYAAQTAYRIYENSQRSIWILSTKPTMTAKLLGMLRIHRYHVSLYENSPELLNDLKHSPPDLLLFDSTEQFVNNEVYALVDTIRQQFNQNQLPIMACEPSARISYAIKLMKYGVNDFYNTRFSAEEFYVRVDQNISQARNFRHIEHISQTDALTGLYNRGHFFKAGNLLFNQLKAQKKYFFAIMADIDHFKKVNDTLGHQKGDEAILFVAQTLSVVFSNYLVARFGGEEFCVMGETEDATEIETLCERVRCTVEREALIKTEAQFTLSIGLTYSGDTLEKAINQADAALYSAKENGRNQVTVQF
ncbi:MAG: diguanylate cyclase [Gammaproteobacteria bacterium]|nr:diguanylate cyclase [Gammaproteobacteria bacterium]